MNVLMLLMLLMLLKHECAYAADALILLNQDQLADLSKAFCSCSGGRPTPPLKLLAPYEYFRKALCRFKYVHSYLKKTRKD